MILVTGGTGLVGSHLLFSLLQENETIRAVYRKTSQRETIKKVFSAYTTEVDSFYNRIEWVEAEITDIPLLSDAFQDVTFVYHCAAIIDFDPSQYALLNKINIEGTANIVNLCLHYKVKKMCYVSSVATLSSEPDKPFMDERSFWNPDEKNSVYAISKYGSEMEVWRGTQEGLQAVIVNPGIILGLSPNAEGSAQIVNLAKKNLPFYPPGGTGFVAVQDVVRAMLHLMKSNISTERFVMVAENLEYHSLLNMIAELLGKKPAEKALPKYLANALSSLEWIASLFGRKRKLPRDTVRSMYLTNFYDASKIKKELQFSFTPIKDVIAEMLTVED